MRRRGKKVPTDSVELELAGGFQPHQLRARRVDAVSGFLFIASFALMPYAGRGFHGQRFMRRSWLYSVRKSSSHCWPLNPGHLVAAPEREQNTHHKIKMCKGCPETVGKVCPEAEQLESRLLKAAVVPQPWHALAVAPTQPSAGSSSSVWRYPSPSPTRPAPAL
jgi:hypothetical protein